MKIGMLWFDEDCELDVAQKIARASDYYWQKYGRKPNLCFVHPESMDESDLPSDVAVEVKSSQTLLQNHFWIGVEEEAEQLD
ncbi:MAG: hypothetical protein PVI81_08925 [Anaerolineales bacterium]|jgi:hypothetical protein